MAQVFHLQVQALEKKYLPITWLHHQARDGIKDEKIDRISFYLIAKIIIHES
jgi:hypothetical protein